MRFTGLLLTLALLSPAASVVSVAYAGSLVRVMEGPFASALQRDVGLRFEGEAKGSKALANLIAAGLRTPDVFISADTRLLDRLREGRDPRISGYAAFGSARLVIGYSTQSRYAKLFEATARNDSTLLRVLTTSGMRIGRTDPQVDPKGERTIRAVAALGEREHTPDLAQVLLRNAQMFPEEALAVRVETGDLDAGFFYSTEVVGRRMKTLDLPNSVERTASVVYGVARLRDCAHPDAAKRFLSFLLRGNGRSVLQAAGVHFFSRARIVGTL